MHTRRFLRLRLHPTQSRRLRRRRSPTPRSQQPRRTDSTSPRRHQFRTSRKCRCSDPHLRLGRHQHRLTLRQAQCLVCPSQFRHRRRYGLERSRFRHRKESQWTSRHEPYRGPRIGNAGTISNLPHRGPTRQKMGQGTRSLFQQNGLLGRSQHQHIRGPGLAIVSQCLSRQPFAEILPRLQIVEVAQPRHVNETPRCRVGFGRLEYLRGREHEAGGSDHHAGVSGHEFYFERESADSSDFARGIFARSQCGG
mmetsp:Transcript_6963/g.15018  ORF Transcript_6963/g.15018 Transcript_6963/m.15018 type:complete len:252 (-) Transcript_6963:1738-2493(-)